MEFEGDIVGKIKQDPTHFWKCIHFRLTTKARVRELQDEDANIAKENKEKAKSFISTSAASSKGKPQVQSSQ